jgi:hypothetical protein
MRELEKPHEISGVFRMLVARFWHDCFLFSSP